MAMVERWREGYPGMMGLPPNPDIIVVAPRKSTGAPGHHGHETLAPGSG
jgi:hypothetical protein